MSFLAPHPRSRRRKEADQIRFWPIHLLTSVATGVFGSLRRRLWLQQRRARWGRLSFARRGVEFPKQIPIAVLHRMNIRVTRDDSAAVRPINLSLNQFSPYRIRQRVKAKAAKRIPLAFFLPQNVVMWLVLPLTPTAQGRFQMRSQKLHGVELIAFSLHSHPNEMQMIRHQAIGRTEKLFPHCRVQHQFSKPGVKCGRQPTPRALLQSVRPKYNRVALIPVPFQSREFALRRRSHGPGMELPPGDVKRPRRRRGDEARVATGVKRGKNATNPPPYVGGYHAL